MRPLFPTYVHTHKESNSLVSLPPLIKTQSYKIRVPPLMYHLTLITSLKALSLQTFALRVRALIYEFGATQFS